MLKHSGISAHILLACLIISSSYAHDDEQNSVSITTDNQYRYIKSNGIPYSHGDFPNQHNPSSISAQNYNFRVPLYPHLATSVTELEGFMDFGVGLDGIPFDPGTAEFWNHDPNWRYEALTGKINLGIDFNNAHVQPGGEYHYHGMPTELLKSESANWTSHSPLVGYAADGFPIYAKYGYVKADNPNSGVKKLRSSYQLRQGNRAGGPGGKYDGTFTQDFIYVPGSGDLDECNGRTGVTPDYPQGIYYYFITGEFPFVPRCFKGVPDQSFDKRTMDGKQGKGPRGPHGFGPPPPPGGAGMGPGPQKNQQNQQ